MKPTPLLLLVLAVAPQVAFQDDTSPFARAVQVAARALDDGQLELARAQIQRALERDPRSIEVWGLRARWAELAEDRDELVYALHKQFQLIVAQGVKKRERAAFREKLEAADPIAADLLELNNVFIKKLLPLAEKYEGDGRPHSAIRVHKEILALDPERVESQEAIDRIAAAPDPSLAEHAKPKDLLAGVSEEWIREFNEEHSTWDERAKLEGENYNTYTDAGYEVLVRCGEAMEQMNAFYREFCQYGTAEDGKNVPRIDINLFKNRDEYLELGIGPPVEWSGGHFTGNAVETYVGAGGFQEMVGTLFHEAAHQFVSLATNAVGWLNEGLASFFEGTRILANGTVMMNMPANHRLFPLVERMEKGWMVDAWDGMDRGEPSSSTPEKAPTFGIVLANEYPWGPAWYAPTWGVVYFLYNFEDPLDGRFIYRDAFRVFIDKSGGRRGEGAVENFEEVVLGNPKKRTKGVKVENGSALTLPETVAELDEVWKEWLKRLRDEQRGSLTVERPYLQWAKYAIQRGDFLDAKEHFEKGIVAAPDDPDVLDAFADLLTKEFKNKDRATKLVLQALQAVESQDPIDELQLDYLERKLVKLDPKQKTIARVREDLETAVTGLVQSYLAEDLNMQAMDLAWRVGVDFDMPGLFEYFEEAARRSKKSLALWKLAYNEENLDGWASIGNESYRADAESILAEFGEYREGLYDYQFLALDKVTSGDFSMEVEIAAERGRVVYCGLVFGQKSSTDFHAAIIYPPGFDADGERRRGFVDLTSFYGDGSFDVWRHVPIAEDRDVDRSSSTIWRRLRVDVTGRAVDVWIDGEYVATQEFASLDVLRGSFGLLMGPGTARFRNVRYLARHARDPGSLIERELRMEEIEGEGGSRGGSWLNASPPFPPVRRWVQGERTAWDERGPVPQLVVLWGIEQNGQIRLNEWLAHLAKEHADIGLEILCITNHWNNDDIQEYLEENPLPGSVAVDSPGGENDVGSTFDMFSVHRMGLPRLILVDIDGKVA
ncbi:MAG: hypothetical protein O7B99_00780 [Planctomycetota bacterium]|nr:hypothetical protein [Planctomycetota bacterium]